MSFSGQSNPPWQRNSMAAMQNNLQSMQNQLNVPPPNSAMPFQQNSQSQMYSQNLNMAPQGQAFGHSQIGQLQTVGPMFTQAVSYPQTRNMPFQNAGSNQNQGACNMPPQGQPNCINSVGTVSKLNNDCGMINDEVFFHKNVCKGGYPKVGDKVIFEASFTPNSQFKLTAGRVQLANNQSGNMSNNQPPPLMSQNIKGSGYNAVPPPNEYQRQLQQQQQQQQQRRLSPVMSKRSPDRRSGRDKKDSKAKDRDEESDRKRRREESDRGREKERRDRDHDRRDDSTEKRERAKSPFRWSSPKRRRTRAIPRYAVQIPKTLLVAPTADVLELRKRYSTLYIPSDFFHTLIKWPVSFTPTNQFSIHRSCTFHIMQKSVEPPQENTCVYEPEDANYLFSAKVMLMACPSMSEIYQKCFPDTKERDEDVDVVHPSRLINFLVGTRGRNDPMAIGGPWSPSLDGQNPEKDPSVLIKTAIRTCKALTGIDLSGCTQWYRFVELYYHRAEHTNKGKLVPARIETVVIYLPDINSCLPTADDWESLKASYKETYERAILKDAVVAVDPSVEAVPAPASASLTNASEAGEAKSASAGEHRDVPEETEAEPDVGSDKEKREPTHYSELDPKNMKVQDLRDELAARGLSVKGLKPQLVARLMKSLNSEKSNGNMVSDSEDTKAGAEEEAHNEDDPMEGGVEVDMTDIVILDEVYESKTQDSVTSKKDHEAMSEKDKQQLQRKYQLPDTPHIVVHPSKTAKSGKFDCTVMSLSVLLDYRPEDTKERAFEVSLFAELFNEMLMRDFGLNIFKALALQKDKPAASEPTETKSEKEESEKPKETGEVDRNGEKNDKGEKKSTRDRKNSRRADDDTEDDNFSVKSGDKRRKAEKKVIVKPELLLSFVYFDTTHCGYIFDKDLEQLFHVIGLNLSRGQVRTILAKSISRDSLYYRKLTDKEKDDKIEEDAEETTTLEDCSKLFEGNRVFLPIFNENARGVASEDISAEPSQLNGLVVYNGGVVDIGNVLDQLKRTEKSRAEVEKCYTDLKKQNTELQSSSTKSQAKIKDLQAEVKSLNRKLSDADQDVFTLTRKYNDHHSILSSIYDKVSPIFARHKSETSREKDKDRDNKEREARDNHKDKEKEKDDSEDKKSIKSEE